MGSGVDIFARNYKKFHKLAEPCWLEHLWHLCDFLKVEVILHESHNVQPIRKNDKCFMDALTEAGQFSTDALITLGTCRKFKGVHMLSCLVTCDDKEIRPVT